MARLLAMILATVYLFVFLSAFCADVTHSWDVVGIRGRMLEDMKVYNHLACKDYGAWLFVVDFC